MNTADYSKSKQQGARRRQIKTTIEASDARRKRGESATVIRKNKRIESIAKRRNVQGSEDNQQSSIPMSERISNIEALAFAVKSGDGLKQLEATLQFRKLLSIENNPPIQDVVDSGVVPFFVSFLRYHQHPKLQFEAAWALTNIASGTAEHTQTVIELGSIPLMRDLLRSPVEEVREQAIWALGNIAGDSPECRDVVLDEQVLHPLIEMIATAPIPMLRNATWALSNLCRGKPQPRWELVEEALPVLAKLIFSSDMEVITDACWALSYLSDGPNERIQAILETGICNHVISLLTHPSTSVQVPALRVVGNIVTGDDQQTQHALNCNLVQALNVLLFAGKKALRKEACWTLSNITAGSRAQIQLVIAANVVPRLISLVKGNDFETRREAAWALSNITSGGSHDHIRFLVEEGVVEPFCDLLGSSDSKVILVALEGIENILRVGDHDSSKSGVNAVSRRVESCGGLDKIEDLQNHDNTEVYDKAVSILENYFGAEEDQNVCPNQTTTSFSFGGAVENTFSF